MLILSWQCIILTSRVLRCVKAEEFQSSARQLLDWLSNAERSLRYQTPPMPDSEEQLEDHLTQLEVPVLTVCQCWNSVLGSR